MDYDVIILGGGLLGCATACALSKYNLNIAVIEKNFDVADEVSQFITTYVTDGSDIEDEAMYEVLKDSINILEEQSSKANYYFKKEPSLSIYESRDEFNKVLDRVKKRNIKGIVQISKEELAKMYPNIRNEFDNILFHENTGVISPYDQATALGEIAFENGVRFRLEEEVKKIERVSRDEVKVETNKSKYSCRVVVITAFNDLYLGHEEKRVASKVIPLETMLMEKNFRNDIKIMTNVFYKNRLTTSIMPSFAGKSVATIESERHMDYKEVKKNIEKVIGPFPAERVDLLTENKFYEDPVILKDLLEEEGYINIEAKNHYLPGFLPSLTQKITKLVVSKFKAQENSDYVFKRRDYIRLRDLLEENRLEEINEAIKFDKGFGRIICTCSNVTEGEIVNAIRRPLGALTVEGVRRRTGIVFGSCQGSYCMNKIIKILSKELDKKPEEIMNDNHNSRLLKARIKEFNEI